MDQTLQRDAPPRVLVLVCNLEGGWQRHETWGFEGFFCFCQGRVSVMLSFGPHWVDELQHWVGLEKATHTLSHTYLCLSLLSSSITNVILLCIWWHIFLGSDGLGRYPEWKNTVKKHHQDNFQVLNWSFLSVCLPGPMASTVHGRELQDASMVRKMVQQNSARGGQTHRPTSSKRRRPRPRLSHKGPMPF